MKLLVHLHIYYQDQVEYFLSKLKNIHDCEWDLIVTVEEQNDILKSKILTLKQNAKILQVKYGKYNFYSFLEVIKNVDLSEYDYVLELCTQENHKYGFANIGKDINMSGYEFCQEMLYPLISSKKRYKKCLKLMELTNTGIITSEILTFKRLDNVPQEVVFYNKLLQKLHITEDYKELIIGSTFIIKAYLLNYLKNIDIESDNCSQSLDNNILAIYSGAVGKIYLSLAKQEHLKVYKIKNIKLYIKFIFKKILKIIFSITNSKDKWYKILTIFGIKIYFRKSAKFPKQCINYNNVFTTPNSKEYINKRAAIFGCFNAQGKIPENTIKYLNAIKKHTDYIILVSDSPILYDEINKIDGLVDVAIFKHHGEYDFGSYKRGYLELKKLGVLDKVNNIVFFNDSVEFIGDNLDDLFAKANNNDIYGVLPSVGGIFVDKRYISNKHIQSWFIIISDKIFKTDWFNNFIINIKKEKTKNAVIANYELGLSKMLIEHGYELKSYYPLNESNYSNPDEIYANPNNDYEGRLFTKKRFLKK